MEFKNFSLYINQTKIARFIDDLASGKITGTRCKKCGKKYYPPRSDCSDCMVSEMEWIPVGVEGKLRTFTKIHVPPEHFAIPLPRMPFSSVQLAPCPIGVLEVEEGVNLMGWIPKIDIKKIKVGMRMKASPQILPDGKVTIVFEPI